MFLDLLTRRNPGFLDATVALHQAGKLPANCYVLDLDAVRALVKATGLYPVGSYVKLSTGELAQVVGASPSMRRYASWTNAVACSVRPSAALTI